MPVIDGEKFACNSCIKGHRVSGCTHHDRELHHINPKGRPVKQCEHCRGARKSKSHHAKCDCGEKKDKDKSAKDKSIKDISIKDKGDAKVKDNRCCCHSGDKCICGVNKDTMDLKLDTSKLTLHAARAKPQLMSTHSDSTLTVFANGHHKPCHRNNLTAHVSGAPYKMLANGHHKPCRRNNPTAPVSGAPYKIGRPHTLHGSSAFASYTQGSSFGPLENTAPRSLDTHSMSNNDYYAMLGSQRSVDGISMHGLPISPLSVSLDPNSIQDSLFNPRPTAYSHDGNSPTDNTCQLSESIPTQQWPWSSSLTPQGQNFSYGSISTSPSQDCLPNLDNEWAIPSAGLNNPLWSAGDLPLDPSKLNDTLAQPMSHSGESNQHSSTGLTTSSSSHSEVGEPALFGDLDAKNPPSASTEALFWEDNPVFRFATSVQNEMTLGAASLPPYSKAFPSPKQSSGVTTTMDSTSPRDKDTFFSAAELNDVSALAMPNNDVSSSDLWTMVSQDTIFDSPDAFDTTFPNWL